MSSVHQLDVTLLAGARELLALQRAELPQRDDLCGAFCGSLALRAAGVATGDGQPLDQDAVALAAGTTVSEATSLHTLPAGERGRRDYRIPPPAAEGGLESGTSAAGLLRAIEQLSDGRLTALPLAGPWTAETLMALFDDAAGLGRPVALIANLATGHLWGANAAVGQLLGYLLDGDRDGPPPDWDVGHFVCIVGRLRGPGGDLYLVADTYRSLGRDGVHLQPADNLAAAIARPDKPAGGVLAVVSSDDAQPFRARARARGLVEELWDNGSADVGTTAAAA